jgi:hypothetical protein
MTWRVKTEWQLTPLVNLCDVYKELSIDTANFAGSAEVPSFAFLANVDYPKYQGMAIHNNGCHPHRRGLYQVLK